MSNYTQITLAYIQQNHEEAIGQRPYFRRKKKKSLVSNGVRSSPKGEHQSHKRSQISFCANRSFEIPNENASTHPQAEHQVRPEGIAIFEHRFSRWLDCQRSAGVPSAPRDSALLKHFRFHEKRFKLRKSQLLPLTRKS